MINDNYYCFKNMKVFKCMKAFLANINCASNYSGGLRLKTKLL